MEAIPLAEIQIAAEVAGHHLQSQECGLGDAASESLAAVQGQEHITATDQGQQVGAAEISLDHAQAGIGCGLLLQSRPLGILGLGPQGLDHQVHPLRPSEGEGLLKRCDRSPGIFACQRRLHIEDEQHQPGLWSQAPAQARLAPPLGIAVVVGMFDVDRHRHHLQGALRRRAVGLERLGREGGGGPEGISQWDQALPLLGPGLGLPGPGHHCGAPPLLAQSLPGDPGAMAGGRQAHQIEAVGPQFFGADGSALQAALCGGGAVVGCHVHHAERHAGTLQGQGGHAHVFADAEYLKGMADQIDPKGPLLRWGERFFRPWFGGNSPRRSEAHVAELLAGMAGPPGAVSLRALTEPELLLQPWLLQPVQHSHQRQPGHRLVQQGQQGMVLPQKAVLAPELFTQQPFGQTQVRAPGGAQVQGTQLGMEQVAQQRDAPQLPDFPRGQCGFQSDLPGPGRGVQPPAELQALPGSGTEQGPGGLDHVRQLRKEGLPLRDGGVSPLQLQAVAVQKLPGRLANPFSHQGAEFERLLTAASGGLPVAAAVGPHPEVRGGDAAFAN